MYLVWKWDWARADTNHCTEIGANGCDIDSVDSEQDIEQIKETTLDTVRFKVIGVTRDKKYQHALERANERICSDKVVEVDIFKEPNNPIDSKAIVFKCFLEDQWHRIGYIVKEALDDVHEALSTNSIVGVKFGWVKFRFDFQQSGPGFYAGVDITRIGAWSSTVHACASPK